jgi:hypothetical protein
MHFTIYHDMGYVGGPDCFRLIGLKNLGQDSVLSVDKYFHAILKYAKPSD